jgi:hypothetical protein
MVESQQLDQNPNRDIKFLVEGERYFVQHEDFVKNTMKE